MLKFSGVCHRGCNTLLFWYVESFVNRETAAEASIRVRKGEGTLEGIPKTHLTPVWELESDGD
jgi:hypothetical protein